MPDFKTARVRRNVNGETGTIDFTVSGFGTVKAAIVLAGYGITNDALSAHAAISVGMTDGTTTSCFSTRSRDAVTSVTVAWCRRETFFDGVGLNTIVNLHEQASSNEEVELKFSAIITDGIRLAANVANAVPATADVSVEVWLLGGADLSAKLFNDADEPTEGNPDDVAVTGAGFQPTALIAAWCRGSQDATGNANTDSSIGFGFAADSEGGITHGAAVMGVDGSDDPSIVRQTTVDFGILQFLNPTDSVTPDGLTAYVQSFDADGWTWEKSPSSLGTGENSTPMVLALRVENAFTYAGVEDTGTASSKSVTAPGFSPIFGMILPTRRSTINVRADDATAGSFTVGLFSKTEQASQSYTTQDGTTGAASTQTTTNLALEAYRAPLHDGTFGTGAHQGSVTATSQGFDIAFSQFDAATPRFFAYLVIGAPTVFELAEQETIEEEVFGVVHKFAAIDEVETIIETNVESVVRASVFRDFLAQAGHTPVDSAQAGHAAADPAQAGYDQSP